MLYLCLQLAKMATGESVVLRCVNVTVRPVVILRLENVFVFQDGLMLTAVKVRPFMCDYCAYSYYTRVAVTERSPVLIESHGNFLGLFLYTQLLSANT